MDGVPRTSMAMLHCAVALFGVAALFGKWIAAGALVIVWGRVLFATLTLTLVLLWQRKPLRMPADRLRVAMCGILLAVHWFAFFHAIQLSTVAVGLLGYATAPVIVVLLEPWWFRERYSARALAAAALITGGVALMVPQWSMGNATAQGIGWGVVAGFTFALLSLINRQLVMKHDAIRLALHQDAFAALLLCLALPLMDLELSAGDVALLGVLGVFCTALAHALFIQSMRRLPARTAAIVSNLEPVYGIILAALLLGEMPAPRTLAGGGVILLGVLWVTVGGTSSASNPGNRA